MCAWYRLVHIMVKIFNFATIASSISLLPAPTCLAGTYPAHNIGLCRLPFLSRAFTAKLSHWQRGRSLHSICSHHLYGRSRKQCLYPKMSNRTVSRVLNSLLACSSIWGIACAVAEANSPPKRLIGLSSGEPAAPKQPLTQLSKQQMAFRPLACPHGSLRIFQFFTILYCILDDQSKK